MQMAPAPISLQRCRLNIKSGSVTVGQIPLGFCNNKQKVVAVSMDSGICPKISGYVVIQLPVV